MDKDLDILKNIISDYALQMGPVKPRDFNTEVPILSALGASEYDRYEDIQQLIIKLEGALKKFVKDWKTLDKNKINYLMKYGIVQEVMKVEERKGVRREAAHIKASQSKNKSPRTTAKKAEAPN